MDGLMKFLHLFALMLGAGAGFGNMMVAMQARRAGGAPPAALLGLRPLFGRLGLAGIVLIWLTGLWLWIADYDAAPLGWAFVAKLAVAALLLAVVLALNAIFARAARGTPPPAWTPRLGQSTSVLTVIAVALAVYVFG